MKFAQEKAPENTGSVERYGHEDARRDIDLYFSISFDDQKRSREREDAINRVLDKHMTAESAVEKHNAVCQECWEYYQKMKRGYISE